MSRQRIKITQSFNAGLETIFDILTDHQSFGEVINAKIRRVVDGRGDNKNGVGSVRRISSFPVPSFEETVTAFEPNRLMEYKVSKGSPVKNHKGRMEFTGDKGQTELTYTIEFEPKLPFVFFGSQIRNAIEKPISGGLKRLAERYDS